MPPPTQRHPEEARSAVSKDAWWSCSTRKAVARLPPRPKKPAQELAGGAFGDAAVNLRAVVAGRLVEDARAVLDPAALCIVGGEIEPADPREPDRRGAHRARLQRDVEIAVSELLHPQLPGAFAQRQHL